MLRGNMEHVTSEPMAGQGDLHHSSACFGSPFEQWYPHFHAVRDITDRPLLPGNDMQVRVDSTGSRYSWPSIFKALKASQIPCARFLPFNAIKRPLTLNLHNHRKLLIVDGRVGFTGGMNIRQGILSMVNQSIAFRTFISPLKVPS